MLFVMYIASCSYPLESCPSMYYYNIMFQLDEVARGCKSIDTDSLILLHDFVHVAWEWEWDNDNMDDSTDDVSVIGNDGDHVNPYLGSDLSEDAYSDSEDVTSDEVPYLTHTITFKCIGTTHDRTSQETLAKVAPLLENDKEVPVGVFPEPNNVYDAKAICFKCYIDGEWKRIGYIVREALDHVHDAITMKKIISVKFGWVKYLAIWRSGPGFYAGINIAHNGEWHADIVKCSSTR